MSDASLDDLSVVISGYGLEPLRLETDVEWTRHTTVVRLEGGGHRGLGEDVTYGPDDQLLFQERGACLDLAGTYTLAEFSHRLDGCELVAEPPASPADHMFRRWAFESAALDLALRQAGTSLGAHLGVSARPLTFVMSLGLGEPASMAPIRKVLASYPDTRFKIDLSPSWTRELVEELAVAGVVDVVDLKGHYRGAFEGPPPNPEQYRWVAELLPDVWIEDAWVDETTLPVLDPVRDRLTWDAPLHSLADLAQLPFRPVCINIKPSRFGFVSELMRIYDYCAGAGIAMYGGGQYELGPGRAQIQTLASLFHPDAPNDVAPSAYNDELRPGLPTSPLHMNAEGPGFAGG